MDKSINLTQPQAMRLILAAVLLLSACNNPALERGRERVRQGLLDPASAQFRNERVVGDLVCGEVNAKNAFGGYSGFSRFMAESDGPFAEVETPATRAAFERHWREEGCG